ncbi:MAG: S26 family signal peptidase [Planctomycetia bacterium]
MLLRRLLLAGLLIVAVGAWLAAPVRWRVEGLSMAPGLMPGEIAASGWFPWLDRWRVPRRFECWTLVEPDGAMAVKRVWALPGEAIAIVDGDLAVDGAVVIKPPVVLAELALPVAAAIRRDAETIVRAMIEHPVFDDVPFAPDERRLLVPVHDVGITAIVGVTASSGQAPPPVEVRVGVHRARVQLPMAGRFSVVAGRLDGRFVAGAWPVDDGIDVADGAVVPPGGPAAWTLERPWIGSGPVEMCEVAVVGGGAAGDGRVERVTAWRDMHALSPATGTTRWGLGPGECFLLGDFPGGSRDSRHWGPVDVSRLRIRLANERSR